MTLKRKIQLDQNGIQITEDQAQRAVFRWAKDAAILWPELRYMYHTPNEGKRNPYTGQRLKAEGMRSGVRTSVFLHQEENTTDYILK